MKKVTRRALRGHFHSPVVPAGHGNLRRIRDPSARRHEVRILRLRAQARSAQDDNSACVGPETYGTLYSGGEILGSRCRANVDTTAAARPRPESLGGRNPREFAACQCRWRNAHAAWTESGNATAGWRE